MLTSRGLGTVLGDLAAMGFDARWGVLGAANVGANHQRNRIWIVANSNHARTKRRQQQSQISNGQRDLVNSSSKRRSEGWNDHGQDDGSKPATDGQHASQMAHPECEGLEGQRSQPREQEVSESRNASALDNTSFGRYKPQDEEICTRWNASINASWWATEPNVGRVANGVAARVDRLKAIGNGQVPLCAATAWRILQ